MSQRKGSPESGQEFICSLSVVVKLSDYFISFSCFNFFAESIRVFQLKISTPVRQQTLQAVQTNQKAAF